MSYFERYQAGEHVPVWRDMRNIQWNRLQQDASYADTLADVMRVARETMARVKQNIDLLIPRLQSLGYEFGYGLAGVDDPENPWADSDRRWVEQAPPLLSPPLPDLNERFERIRQHLGYVPLSLQAFYEVVGGVNLVGTLPTRWMPCLESLSGADYSILDPLMVDPLTMNSSRRVSRPNSCISRLTNTRNTTSVGRGPTTSDICVPITSLMASVLPVGYRCHLSTISGRHCRGVECQG